MTTQYKVLALAISCALPHSTFANTTSPVELATAQVAVTTEVETKANTKQSQQLSAEQLLLPPAAVRWVARCCLLLKTLQTT